MRSAESESESGSTTGDDGSESESSCSHPNPAAMEVSLSLERLQSLHALQSGPGKPSSYSESGMSVNRCKKALQNPPCPCKCTLPLKLLILVCQSFWQLSKAAQDSLLWSIQLEGGACNRRSWNIAGYPVCREAWLCFLGVGKQRISRCKRKFHGKDERSVTCRGGYMFYLLFKKYQLVFLNLEESDHEHHSPPNPSP